MQVTRQLMPLLQLQHRCCVNNITQDFIRHFSNIQYEGGRTVCTRLTSIQHVNYRKFPMDLGLPENSFRVTVVNPHCLITQRHFHISSPQCARNKPSRIFNDFRASILEKEDFIVSASKLQDMESSIAEEEPEFPYDYSFMKTTVTLNKPDIAMSLMEYIRSKRSPSLEVRLLYIAAVCEKYNERAISEFKDVLKVTTVEEIGSFLYNHVALKQLLKTRYWREATAFIKECNKHQDMRRTIILNTAILDAALRNKDYRIYYDTLARSKFVTHLGDILFDGFVKRCYPMDVFLELMKHDSARLTGEQAEYMMKNCKSHWSIGVQSYKTIVNTFGRQRGTCRCCNNRLPESFLTSDETETIKENLVQVILSLNSRQSLVSKELDKFLNFMAENGPFDCVIDGTNVFKKSKYRQDKNWKLIIGQLLRQDKTRILVICDRPQRALTDEHVSFLLVTPPLDDVFVLLGGLISGPKCYVLSRDAFRDHLFKIKDDEAKLLFKKWQSLRHAEFENRLEFPCNFSSHETESGWHVPYGHARDCLDKKLDSNYILLPDTYLCLQKPYLYKPSEELMELRGIKQAVINQYSQIYTSHLRS